MPDVRPQPGIAGAHLALPVLALTIAVQSGTEPTHQGITIGEADLRCPVIEVVNINPLPYHLPLRFQAPTPVLDAGAIAIVEDQRPAPLQRQDHPIGVNETFGHPR